MHRPALILKSIVTPYSPYEEGARSLCRSAVQPSKWTQHSHIYVVYSEKALYHADRLAEDSLPSLHTKELRTQHQMSLSIPKNL